MKNIANFSRLTNNSTLARLRNSLLETGDQFSRDIEATVQSFYQSSPRFVLPDLAEREALGADRPFQPAKVHPFRRKIEKQSCGPD